MVQNGRHTRDRYTGSYTWITYLTATQVQWTNYTSLPIISTCSARPQKKQNKPDKTPKPLGWAFKKPGFFEPQLKADFGLKTCSVLVQKIHKKPNKLTQTVGLGFFARVSWNPVGGGFQTENLPTQTVRGLRHTRRSGRTDRTDNRPITVIVNNSKQPNIET